MNWLARVLVMKGKDIKANVGFHSKIEQNRMKKLFSTITNRSPYRGVLCDLWTVVG